MAADYCTRFGLTPKRRKSLLQSVELTAADHRLAERLREQVILPAVDRLTDEFYDKLSAMDEARDILDKRPSLEPLKQTMRGYLSSLGREFDRPDYFESRLKVGLAHVTNNIPLTVYIFAYRLLEGLIQEAFPASLTEDRALREFVSRIMTLDMALAAETYHKARINELEDSLVEMQYEESYLLMLAHSDSLTGLPNHERGLELLDEAWHRCKGRHPLCVIMADLDHFKRVNDEHGHVIGDSILRESAARIRAAVRKKDKVSRYGGEEFLIILEDTPLDTATEVAGRILERIATTPVKVDQVEISLTISLGISQAREQDSVKDMVATADRALYQAKRGGRNQWIVYEDEAAGS